MKKKEGKRRCEYVKQIRKKVADENGIPYEPVPCFYDVECSGTCSSCEQELSYINHELENKKSLWERVKRHIF